VDLIKSYPFDSNKKTSSCIVRQTNATGGFRRYYKGAAERIVELCDRYVDLDGEIKAFDAASKQHLIQSVEKMTTSGYRTIAFCCVDIEEIAKDDTGTMIDPVETDRMIYIGAAGIQDPLRPESRQAVLECQRAGIIVRMVTGDHLETAKFIATDCGILTSPDHISMTGAKFRLLIRNNAQKELEEIVPKLRVLARSEPSDKEHLVNWLKAHGEVVAATGDGTNDAQALKAADVGIAMAIAGTDVAKAAAKIQILDDNFASIVEAVKWGRSVYDNIRKFVQFQLTVNLVPFLITHVTT
jgi:Ca2+-transporting ATPase